MTDQSSLFKDQFQRVAINIKQFLEELDQQEISVCFIHIQVELNKL